MDDTTVGVSNGRTVGVSIVKPDDTGRLAGRSVGRPIDRPTNRPTDRPADQSASQSAGVDRPDD